MNKVNTSEDWGTFFYPEWVKFEAHIKDHVDNKIRECIPEDIHALVMYVYTTGLLMGYNAAVEEANELMNGYGGC